MCGLSGLIKFDDEVSEKELALMLPGIAHRGPDGTGTFVHGGVGLLHARLSIIDTSENANQPLYNEDKTLVLICNGEIYNHLVLRKSLESKGHRFHCNSDCEVLLHLYEEYRGQPQAMLNLLNGMFAFAIYDKKDNRVFLARDRFGIKPLYYHHSSSVFYFASEIKSILGINPKLKEQLDYSSLYEYYQFLSIPEPNTIIESIKCLPAGHFMHIRRDGTRTEQWYSLEKMPAKNYDTADSFSESLLALTETVVKEHLIADVPLGSFLSAGIDSTVITHFAKKHSDHPFTSITAAFRGYDEDESSIARQTAQKMGVNHHSYILKEGFFNDFASVSKHFDQPFGVSSAYSLFRISALARKNMKVVLSGDGGDEVFAGYDYKHKAFYIPKVVSNAPPIVRPLLGKILKGLPGSASKLGEQYSLKLADRFLNRCRVMSEGDALSFIPEPHRKKVDMLRFRNFVDASFERSSELSRLHQLLFADIHTFLKSEMLYKVDRMTMANSLEGRVPFLDHRLVEMAFSVPPHFLRNDHFGKLPFRKWVEQHYPGLGFRTKTGFNTPVHHLLNADKNTTLVMRDMMETTRETSLIDPKRIDVLTKNNFNREDVTSVMLLAGLSGWCKNVIG